MKHLNFTAAGVSGNGIEFRVEGELHIEDHASDVDAAAACVKKSFGMDDLQFTKIKCTPMKEGGAK